MRRCHQKNTVSNYNFANATAQIAEITGLPPNKLLFVGSDTPAAQIIAFLESAKNETAQLLQLTEEQRRVLLAGCRARSPCEEECAIVEQKMSAVMDFIQIRFMRTHLHDKFETDALVIDLSTFLYVLRDQEKERLFALANGELQEIQLFGKINVTLNLQFKRALDLLSKSTSYAVSYNEYRRCPFCHLVWTKVEGCDGSTTCGEIPSRFQDKTRASYLRYRFEFAHSSDGKWTFEYHPVELRGRFMDDPIQQRRNKGWQGCGQRITWCTMPPVDAEILFTSKNAKPRKRRTSKEIALRIRYKQLPNQCESVRKEVRSRCRVLSAMI